MKRKTLLLMMLMALISSGAWAQETLHRQYEYVDVSYGGTSSNYEWSGGDGYGDPQKLIDDQLDNSSSANSKWCIVQINASQWLTTSITFKTASPIIPVKYVFYPGYDTGHGNTTYPNRNPKSWKIYASNSNGNWTKIDERSLSSNISTTDETEFSLNNTSTAYQYFKFEIDDVQGKEGNNYIFQLGEFRFKTVNSGGGDEPSDYVEIGTGTSTAGYAPVYGNYKSSYVQMIYTHDQLQAVGITSAGTITKIGFNSSSANDYSRKPIIYIGHTDKTSFSSTTDFVSINDLEEVYYYSNHSQWNITSGWNEFELDTPFEYDGQSNIVIAMHCGLISSFSSSSFYYTSTTNKQVIYARSDSTDPIPSNYEGNWSSYGTSYLGTSEYLPNLRLYYTENTSTSEDCEGFEGGSTPDGWTINGTGDKNWAVGTSVGSGISPRTGSYCIGTPQGTSSRSAETWLITPSMDLSNATSATLHFYYYNKSWGSDIDYFGVHYRVNNGSWQALMANSNTSTSDWTEIEIELPGLAANYQIGFYRKDNYGNGVGLDDICITITSSGGSSHPFTIASKTDWEAFCTAVNGGYDYAGKTVTMTADITDAVTTMAGTESHPFKGTFDGQGHTLTVGITGNQTQGQAPFQYINGATIKNLVVTGSVTATSGSYPHAAGLVGFAWAGTNTIENCAVHTNVTNNGSNVNSHIGGIVGHAKTSTVVLKGCVYDGLLTSSHCKGGLVGWADAATIQLTDCLFNGTVSTTSNFHPIGCCDNGSNIISNSSYVNNCYYYATNNISSQMSDSETNSIVKALTNKGKRARSITAGTNVTVANAGTATTYSYSGITGYGTGIKYNDVLYAGQSDKVSLTLNYSGTIPSGQELNGYTASNGGSISGSNPYTLTMPNNNTVISADISAVKYHIANNVSTTAMTWDQFAAKVSGGKNYSGETVYLDEDITTAVTAMAGTIEGETLGNAFKGTFDGQGYSINFNITGGEGSGWNFTAPFRCIDGATIKNLKTTGTVTQTSGKGAAGLVGCATGTCTITNCDSHITIASQISGDGTHGGFISYIKSGTTTFNGCAFTGSITGSSTRYCGGFVGWKAGSATFNNCVFAPTAITFDADHTDDNSANFSRNGGTFNNCYYTQTCGSVVQGKLRHTVTGDTGVTVAMNGTATANDVSKITSYANNNGLLYNGTIWAGSGDNVNLNLTASGSGDIFYATNASITGSGPYTLAMPDADVVVKYGDAITITSTPASTENLTPGTEVVLTASTIIPMSPGNYSFEVASGSYSAISGTSSVSGDDNYSSAISLGNDFTFNYWGVDYTSVVIATNGYIKFVGSSSNDYSNDLASSSYYNVLAAFWDDLDATSTQYTTTGTAPYRVFIMQHNGYRHGDNSNPFTYQIKLYETTNVIEFCYGDGFPNVSSSNTSASIGLNNRENGVTSFISVTPTGVGTATTSTSSANNSIGATQCDYLTSGTIYRFTPPTPTYTWAYTGTAGTADGDTYTVTPTQNSSYTASLTVGGQTYSQTVEVTLTNFCATPTNLRCDRYTPTSATLSWTPGGDETQWHVQYGPQGSPNPQILSTTDNPYVLTLTADYTYEIKVRAVCDNDNDVWSEWSNTITVTPGTMTFIFTNNGGDGDSKWNTPNNWSPVGLPTTDDDVEIRADAIIPSGYTALANDISFYPNPITGDLDGSITIENGGQLQHNNEGVVVTVKRDIADYGSVHATTNLGYKIISFPVSGITPENESIEGLLTDPNPYDFYTFIYYSDHLEWMHVSTDDGLEPTKGYLYASQEGTTISVTGEVAPSVNSNYELPYQEGVWQFNGWQLVGNPFVCNAYLTAQGSHMDFYEIQDKNGYAEFVTFDNTDAIPPMGGVMVWLHATDNLVYSRTAPSKGPGILNMDVNKASMRGTTRLDRARIRFGEGRNLEKLQLNPRHTKLYIPEGGNDYAVYYAEGAGTIPVNFKAQDNGRYTLDFSTEDVGFNYLHLIDNMNGNDVDLLQTPYYAFDAKSTDFASRFTLVFATGSSTGSETGTFAFFNNGNWIINNDGEATLQIVDALGRILSSETISGSCSKAVNATPGVYMLRLINGNDVKVQKIVVRR